MEFLLKVIALLSSGLFAGAALYLTAVEHPARMSQGVLIGLQEFCQFRLKIPHCTGRKFPTPKLHEWASLASDGVEPSAVFWRVLGVTESEAKERAAASAPSCPRGGTRPALRRSFNR